MKPLISIAKSLIRISKNIARIKTILEIVHKDKLQYHELEKQYYKYNPKEKDSDREFYVGSPLMDQYDEPIEQDLDLEQELEQESKQNG